MRESPSVLFDAETYALVVGTLAKYGSFRSDGNQIEGALDVGFSVSHGPELFDEIASEMAEDRMEITETAATQIARSFQIGFSTNFKNTNSNEEAIDTNLDPSTIPCVWSSGLLSNMAKKCNLLNPCTISFAR